MLKRGIDIINETRETLNNLQSGIIRPITTGDEELDKMCLGGLLPGTVVAIIARSTHGKTHELELLQRHIAVHEPDVIILQCNWELEVLKLVTREVAVTTGKTLQEVITKKPEGEVLNKLEKVFDRFKKANMYFQEKPPSAKEFAEDIRWLYQHFSDRRILITIDNLENCLNTENNQKLTMDKMLQTINFLKKEHFFSAWVILNQANNELVKRIQDPKQHRPDESCIYGTDQLYKLADVVQFKVIPYKMGVADKYMVFGKERYDHLKEFKLPSAGATTSFDPVGNVFRFYLKHRRVGEKNVPDLFIESMYTRESVGMAPAGKIAEPKLPSTKKKTPSTPMVITAVETLPLNTLNSSTSQGEGF